MATDRLINLILLFFAYAFLGWCIEVTLKYKSMLYSKLLAVLYIRVNKFFTEKLALVLDEC